MHKRLTYHRIRELPGNRLHCFHQNVMNKDHMWSSVFGNANLSNLSGTLLKGSKDHLLTLARSDLAKRELHVESLNKCIGEAQNRALQDVQNEFVESRREQTRLQEELLRKEKALRDTQIRSKHETGKNEESASTAS